MSLSYKGIAKKCTSPSNEFRLHKCSNNFFFFSYLKIFISPANEFLLHKCRKKKNKNMKKKIFTSPANEFLLHRIE